MGAEIAGLGEGLADASTAAVVARAVEPAAGVSNGHTGEQSCLNCDTPLLGPHCHACGQRAHVHRTLGAFLHDLLHGVLHFEGKIWRTVPLLVWQPGKFTREYIDGKRARYVSPIALFLFVVFLSFALFNALGGPLEDGVGPEGQSLVQVKTAYETGDAELSELLERRRDMADPAAVVKIDNQITEVRERQAALKGAMGSIGSDFTNGFAKNPIPADSKLGQVVQHVRDNPQLAIYKAQTSAYKYSWMLVPLSVPFVWLLFPFSRRFRGYDHTVFVTYSIAFMIALIAAVSLLFYVNFGGAGILVLLYAPFHMYRHIRGTYGTTRLGAIWRMLALSLFAWIAIALFALAIFWLAGA
jgi:chorismate mutase